jgi:hypothetical protein
MTLRSSPLLLVPVVAAGAWATWTSCIPIPIPIPVPVPNVNSVPAVPCDGGTTTIQVFNRGGPCNLVVTVETSEAHVIAPGDDLTFAANYAGTYSMTFASTTTGCSVDPSSCGVKLECGKEGTVWANEDPPGSSRTKVTCR